MKKIKIIFVQHSLVCGGAEQALFDLINLLDKDKFDVTVFAQRNDGEWDEKFRDAGIRVEYDYSCRRPSWNPLVKLQNLRKKLLVRRALNNDGQGLLDICCPGADIVVSYSTKGCEQIGFAKGAKAVQYIHGDLRTNPHYRELMLKKQAFLPQFDRIVCVSEGSRESFSAVTGLKDNVCTLFNPLNSDQVRLLAREPVSLPAGEPLICAVGRLSIEKGFDRLVYIHRRLLDQGIRHKLVIVGDGEDWDLINRMVRTTGTQDSVILAGYQSNPYPYMKASKFLVNASYTEGLPVIAMEALCLGVPMVAPVPSVAEAFGEEFCGLITENDTPSLEEGIRRMLTDDDLYARARVGARRRSAFFDGKQMVKKVEELFVQLVSEP